MQGKVILKKSIPMNVHLKGRAVLPKRVEAAIDPSAPSLTPSLAAVPRSGLINQGIVKPRPVVRPLPIAHKTPQEGGGGASSHGAGQGGSSLENLSKVKVGSNDASYDHHNGKSKGGRGHKKEYEPPFAEEMHTYPEVLNVKTLGEGDMMHLNSGFSDMVYIGRDDKDPKGRGRFGNPFPIGRFYGNRHDVIARHRKWLASAILYTKTGDALLKDIRDTIGGKKPVCFCAPEACHGDFLRLVANCPEKDLHDFLAHYAG